MPFVNIFESDFSLPPRVCILAPGPNGRGHYGDIPTDFYMIAVSKAVLIPCVRPDVWMMNHSDQSWFEEADAAFGGVRVFGDGAIEEQALADGGRACYYFKPPAEPLDSNFLRPIDGVIRIGGSIVGCALQLAYNFGGKEILLCGADMSGDGYWDGTDNRQLTHGETWPAARRVNLLVRWMAEAKGIRVFTLSPTRLDVPKYESALEAQ